MRGTRRRDGRRHPLNPEHRDDQNAGEEGA
jgi:hypothetical protein